nr:MAG TPA: hypothetical protein [Caudoviricetes sp.]
MVRHPAGPGAAQQEHRPHAHRPEASQRLMGLPRPRQRTGRVHHPRDQGGSHCRGHGHQARPEGANCA